MKLTVSFRILLGVVITLLGWETADAAPLIVFDIAGTTGSFRLDSPSLHGFPGAELLINPPGGTVPSFATDYNFASRPVGPPAGPGAPPIPGPGPDPTHFIPFGINRIPTMVVPVAPCPTPTCPPALFSFNVGPITGGFEPPVPLEKEIDMAGAPAETTFPLSGVSALVPTNATDHLIIQGMETAGNNPFPSLFSYDTLQAFSVTLIDPGVNFENTIENGGTIIVNPDPNDPFNRTSGTFRESNSTSILFLTEPINPVPEPSSLALLSIGILAAMGCSWRRRVGFA